MVTHLTEEETEARVSNEHSCAVTLLGPRTGQQN